MRKCRLNPVFKSWLTRLSKLLLQLLCLLVVYTLIIGAIGSFMYLIEVYSLMTNLITTFNTELVYIPNVYMYIMMAGHHMFWIMVIFIISLVAILLILYVTLAGLYKLYKQSKVIFNGQKPWYKVLLSFIVICEKDLK